MGKKLYSVLFLGLFFLSCKKQSTFVNPHMASISIVNAVVGGSTVKMGSNTRTIPNNTYWPLTLSGNNKDLYVWPINDSLRPYYHQSKFEIEDRANYSLFLGGFSTAVDALLLKDELPNHRDSTCGIRFVNLCPNSIAINITLANSPTQHEAHNLGYKQYSSFKIYPAKASNTSFAFQIRRASDDSLLTTYTLFSTPHFLNETLVIRGLVGASPTIGITEVRY